MKDMTIPVYILARRLLQPYSPMCFLLILNYVRIVSINIEQTGLENNIPNQTLPNINPYPT